MSWIDRRNNKNAGSITSLKKLKKWFGEIIIATVVAIMNWTFELYSCSHFDRYMIWWYDSCKNYIVEGKEQLFIYIYINGVKLGYLK